RTKCTFGALESPPNKLMTQSVRVRKVPGTDIHNRFSGGALGHAVREFPLRTLQSVADNIDVRGSLDGGIISLWCDQQHAATSADTALQLFAVGRKTDVREAARKIKCPVLIVHPERDRSVPIEEGRLLASLIPHCRFVQLDSENHMPLADEPAWSQLVAHVRSFLAEPDCVRANGGNSLRFDELTLRERAVLEGIAEGLNNSQIAASLRLSEKTVRNHITRVFDKLCVEQRCQAIVLAREAGLGRGSRLINQH